MLEPVANIRTVDRGKLLTNKLFPSGYHITKLVSTVKKLYVRHHDLVDPYNVAVSKLFRFDILSRSIIRLVMSVMVSFCAVLFPTRCLG